jgi:hypothetical protein
MDVDKVILDACCGCKQMWFDKDNKNTIFMDIREESQGFIQYQTNCAIKPDILADYRNMPFKDKSFKLVVWDIPHMIGTHITGIIMQKYGYLDKDTWKSDLKLGFDEIMRVLDDYGVLEFKFADVSISVKEIISIFGQSPLFGTKTKKGVNNTYWFCFMKGLK